MAQGQSSLALWLSLKNPTYLCSPEYTIRLVMAQFQLVWLLNLKNKWMKHRLFDLGVVLVEQICCCKETGFKRSSWSLVCRIFWTKSRELS